MWLKCRISVLAKYLLASYLKYSKLQWHFNQALTLVCVQFTVKSVIEEEEAVTKKRCHFSSVQNGSARFGTTLPYGETTATHVYCTDVC